MSIYDMDFDDYPPWLSRNASTYRPVQEEIHEDEAGRRILTVFNDGENPVEITISLDVPAELLLEKILYYLTPRGILVQLEPEKPPEDPNALTEADIPF